MNISKFQNIKISEILEKLYPDDFISIDTEGNLFKSPIETITRRDLDGGFSMSVYLPVQNVDFGSASTIYSVTHKIDGGNA